MTGLSKGGTLQEFSIIKRDSILLSIGHLIERAKTQNTNTWCSCTKKKSYKKNKNRSTKVISV